MMRVNKWPIRGKTCGLSTETGNPPSWLKKPSVSDKTKYFWSNFQILNRKGIDWTQACTLGTDLRYVWEMTWWLTVTTRGGQVLWGASFTFLPFNLDNFIDFANFQPKQKKPHVIFEKHIDVAFSRNANINFCWTPCVNVWEERVSIRDGHAPLFSNVHYKRMMHIN